jgi:ABC-type sugar transport system ATPase subunit
MVRQSRQILESFDLWIDPRTRVATLGIAYQQIIEIAKAVTCEARVIVMDEPTAALTQRETDMLMQIIRDLRQRGCSIIYISHRLDEIRHIADRVTVLRDGRHIITAPQSELPAGLMIRHMVGRDVEQYYPKEALPRGEVLLEVQGLSRRGVCEDVSFQLRRGEILGFAGLAGSGRTEIAELLFGRRKPDHGTIRIGGRQVRVRSPRSAIRNGIGLIPEERKADGLVLSMSVFDNATLSILRRHSTCGIIWRRRLRELVESVAQRMRLKAASPWQRVKNLSGGNQQKVVLAKWLLHDCQIYIFDEPTRGVDVGAKREIYRLMEDLARGGAGVLMISSDLPEILNMSDRIMVVREGRIAGQMPADKASQESIMQLAVGPPGATRP